jgi:hypothetical protein
MGNIALPALSLRPPQTTNPLEDWTRIMGLQHVMQANQQQRLELQDDAKLRSLFTAGADHPEWETDDWMRHGQQLGLGISGMTKLSQWATAHATSLAQMGQEQQKLFASITDKTQGMLQDILDAPPEQKLQAQQKAKGDALNLITATKGLAPAIRDSYVKNITEIPDDQYVGDDVVALKMGEHNFHNMIVARAEQAAKTAEAAGKAKQAEAEANLATAKVPGAQAESTTQQQQAALGPTGRALAGNLYYQAASGDAQANKALQVETQVAGSKAGAEAAAKFPWELQLKQQEMGNNPVYAFDPKTNQRVLTTVAEAKAQGLTNPTKVSESDVEKDTAFLRQMNDVQLNVSRYKAAMNAIPGNISKESGSAMTRIISDASLNGFLTQGGTLGALMDQISQGEKAKAWNKLSPEEQQAVMGYFRSKGSIIAYQKALTQQGRTNKEALDIEMNNLPSPIVGATVANKQIEAFQENIDTAAQGAPRIPWMETPTDVRARVEGQAAQQYNQRQAAKPQGRYKAASGNPVKVGQNIQIPNRPGLSRVTKVYQDGTFDATQ